jgi:hypothetical protein
VLYISCEALAPRGTDQVITTMPTAVKLLAIATGSDGLLAFCHRLVDWHARGENRVSKIYRAPVNWKYRGQGACDPIWGADARERFHIRSEPGSSACALMNAARISTTVG